MSIDEGLAMIRDGRIQDAKAIMLLQWAVLDGPFAGPSPQQAPQK